MFLVGSLLSQPLLVSAHSVQVERGYEFESDTDTEVIPKLLNYLYQEEMNVRTIMKAYYVLYPYLPLSSLLPPSIPSSKKMVASQCFKN